MIYSPSSSQALNKLNAEWNFCTDTEASSGSCNGLDVVVDCSRRNRIARDATHARTKRQAEAAEYDDVYEVKISFPSVKSVYINCFVLSVLVLLSACQTFSFNYLLLFSVRRQCNSENFYLFSLCCWITPKLMLY